MVGCKAASPEYEPTIDIDKQISHWRDGARNDVEAARALLVHVSNCDGLAILSERLKPEELDELGEKFESAREAGVPLLRWAESIRKR